MAGSDNLKPLGGGARTKDEQREIQRRGGIASGAARRRKRALKTAVSAILSAKLPDEAADSLRRFGIDPEDADYQAAVVAALIKKAMSGNIRAIEVLFTLTADDPFVKARQTEVKVRQEEAKIKREELEHRQRMDEARMEREGAADDELAAAWLQAVLDAEAQGE